MTEIDSSGMTESQKSTPRNQWRKSISHGSYFIDKKVIYCAPEFVLGQYINIRRLFWGKRRIN